ncbi:hypothetical protein PIB30_096369 [Stylosanthes scabra]|uniref:F-box domain-containing protein n=1 Tax=Stylosanthes scabra TaxID=79078 RepID=A0ABU6YYV4_9FABA|nr:hypothetical protein [Stylosanthes scabra]
MGNKGSMGNKGAYQKSVDRISNLPQSLIYEILSRLPIRECVATCVLSRSWRNRWKDLQILNFSTKGILLQKDHMRFIDFLKWFLLQQHGAIVPKLRIHYYAAYELGFDEAALKALISAAIGYHL